MIPEFDDNGRLPPGIHLATFTELERRFGQNSEIRRVQTQSLRWLIEIAKRAGVSRLVINGSFVTDEFEPNDVDCAILLGSEYPKDLDAASELTKGLPFLHIDLGGEDEFDWMVNDWFATDRLDGPKGVVEIELWN